jgi:hypothetical protein
MPSDDDDDDAALDGEYRSEDGLSDRERGGDGGLCAGAGDRK